MRTSIPERRSERVTLTMGPEALFDPKRVRPGIPWSMRLPSRVPARLSSHGSEMSGSFLAKLAAVATVALFVLKLAGIVTSWSTVFLPFIILVVWCAIAFAVLGLGMMVLLAALNNASKPFRRPEDIL